jgi:ribonuclease BN (tRNA processing enzyme)
VGAPDVVQIDVIPFTSCLCAVSPPVMSVRVRMTIVGCAGSYPTASSAASCYLVEQDDGDGRTWRVLLDLGSGALGPLQRYLRPQQIDAILLSHLHPDHFIDTCGLYVALRYDPAGQVPRPVPIYGPSGTRERLIAAYGADDHGSLDDVYDVFSWVPGEPVAIGPIRVTPFEVEHPVEAYGMRVEGDGRVLAYSGDTDTCSGLDLLAAGADLLLSEASFVEGREDARGIHLTGRRAGLAAAGAGVASLMLTHIPAWTDAEGALAEARSAYDGPISLAVPGAVVEL